jgi:hypothetical protein
MALNEKLLAYNFTVSHFDREILIRGPADKLAEILTVPGLLEQLVELKVE